MTVMEAPADGSDRLPFKVTPALNFSALPPEAVESEMVEALSVEAAGLLTVTLYELDGDWWVPVDVSQAWPSLWEPADRVLPLSVQTYGPAPDTLLSNLPSAQK